jgi:hypothetical protein
LGGLKKAFSWIKEAFSRIKEAYSRIKEAYSIIKVKYFQNSLFNSLSEEEYRAFCEYVPNPFSPLGTPFLGDPNYDLYLDEDHDLDQDRKLEEKNRASAQASRNEKILISTPFAISSPFAITISCGTLVVLLFIFFSNYWLGMGTNKPLFFLCAKEHSARNLLLLGRWPGIVSDTYLTSSRSREPRFHPGFRQGSWVKTHIEPASINWWGLLRLPRITPITFIDGVGGAKGTRINFINPAPSAALRRPRFSTYNRLSGTRGSIASVNYNRTRYMTSPLQLIEAGCFAYPAPHQRSVMGKIGGSWGTRINFINPAPSVRPTDVRGLLSSTLPQQIFGYSTFNQKKIHPISPWFISGFSDAEGCFNVGLQKNPNGKFYVRPLFQIKVHSRDNLLLMRIKDYFGGIGNIYISSKDSKFMVRSLDEILKIISHFDNYPLITQKKSDFILFKQIIHKMVEGEHFLAKGLQEIVNIRASINLGLSDSLKAIFPNTVPVTRPRIENITIPHPEWMAGFVTAAPKNNLRLAISILGGDSKNIKRRVSLNKKFKNLYEQYCEASQSAGHLPAANNPLFVRGVRKYSRLYSTNLAASEFNEHSVHSSYGADRDKSLVVWGLNLTSTVGIKFSRNQLAMVKLPPYERSVIIGLILSDGWLRFVGERSKNAQFGFLQSGANGKYFFFVFLILSRAQPTRSPSYGRPRSLLFCLS